MEICKEKELCTGCTACAHVCPKKCINMVRDSEGFFYPQINEDECISCHSCIKCCPVNNKPEGNKATHACVVRNKDPFIVENSTSGGMCSALAEFTFAQDGILYGAGYDNEMRVRHFGISREESSRIAEMQGSKYVQSDLKNTFISIKEKLRNGTFVCFVGTPCQVAGLSNFLKQDYPNLLKVDLVCHGVSSPLLFEHYIAFMQKKYNSKIVDARFRNKTYGYHSGTMMLEFKNGKKYYGSGRIDYMLKGYFNGAYSRYSCYRCPFKGEERFSDMTIFDSWHIEKLVPDQKDDDKGFTNVLINTQKGESSIKAMANVLQMWDAEIMPMIKLDGVMINNYPSMAVYRGDIIKGIANEDFYSVAQRYMPVSTKDHMVERIKALLYKMGILSLIKKQ